MTVRTRRTKTRRTRMMRRSYEVMIGHLCMTGRPEHTDLIKRPQTMTIIKNNATSTSRPQRVLSSPRWAPRPFPRTVPSVARYSSTDSPSIRNTLALSLDWLHARSTAKSSQALTSRRVLLTRLDRSATCPPDRIHRDREIGSAHSGEAGVAARLTCRLMRYTV